MKPILFSTPMVQAILEGRKTQTRRIVKEIITKENGLVDFSFKGHSAYNQNPEDLNDYFFGCIRHAKYQPEDILWVRETWMKGCEWDGDSEMPPLRYYYRADEDWKGMDWHDEKNDCAKAEPTWKPPIFMPKEAARIFLKVTNVRVERLQDISEEDAIAEGIEPMQPLWGVQQYRDYLSKEGMTTGWPCLSFLSLWQSINGNWNENPWVFVYDFERTEKPITQQI